ncbi:MAG: Cgl0159 family (beta/alpha)8-fold protein, partial [Mycobacteriales bacterium]
VRAIRAGAPDAIGAAAAQRRARDLPGTGGGLLIVAADHPARGALAVGAAPMAMGSRVELLRRLVIALSRPGVDGVLGTPDVLDDLLLMGALEDKVVVGSMNRGGLTGAAFELDDRFTAYDAGSIADAGFDAGKMLCRIDLADRGSLATLTACASAIDDLVAHGLIAMVEPFMATRRDGRVVNDLRPEAVIRSINIAQGLGASSSHSWLKLPVLSEMDEVMAATTLPTLLLGGDPAGDQDQAFASWEKALAAPGVRGLIVGRSLLYPPGDDVANAVDTAASLVHPPESRPS